MTRKWAIRIEIVGAALVLASAGWELFIERPITDMQHDSVSFRIEDKLDHLWLQIGAIRHKVDPDTSFFWTISPTTDSETWPMAGDRKQLAQISRQAAFARGFRGALFLIGSLMLILARRNELVSKSASTATPEQHSG
ncbi:MAG: hypothetical protein ACREFF_15680 [Candidatus Udaeobacter sp.]